MKLIENHDGQFMLLAGFIIAIGLVITTIMLSNIIFEGNMAGEAGTDPAKYDIVNLMQVARDEMRSAYRNATEMGGNTQNNFSKEMKSFSANLSMTYAVHGEGINVSWDTSNWDSNSYSKFTDNGTASGATDWVLIENVKNSTLKLNVTSPGAFKINVSGQSNYWLIIPSNSFSATITNVTPPYSIIFINGASTSGNYSIAGNTTYGRNFIRARDYIFNATVTLSTSTIRANITIPVSVPW